MTIKNFLFYFIFLVNFVVIITGKKGFDDSTNAEGKRETSFQFTCQNDDINVFEPNNGERKVMSHVGSAIGMVDMCLVKPSRAFRLRETCDMKKHK
jgi:hypothetical protein